MPDPETDMKSPAFGPGNEDNTAAHCGQKGKNYIIAIGIDQYGNSLVNDFGNRNCEKDCNDLLEVLTHNYENFELYKDCRLLNEQATKEAIGKAILGFIRDVDANNTNNNLVLFDGIVYLKKTRKYLDWFLRQGYMVPLEENRE